MQKNQYVKITTPSGVVNVVPAASNKAYYEKLNAQEKDASKRYKLEEPTDEEVAKYFPEVAKATAATAKRKEALATAEAKVAELAKAKEEAENLLAAANAQVRNLQEKLNKATK